MATKIIGRVNEQELLSEYCDSNEAELLVVYGRRRIGKTFLVREFFENQFSFSSTGLDGGDMKAQLNYFDKQLVKQGFAAGAPSSNWFDAFDKLEKFLSSPNVQINRKTGRRVVFLDEIPWMDTRNSNFMMAFEAFWNCWANWQDDLVVIVCGSTSSWILDKLIHAHGGLYKRVTHSIPLVPFTLAEVEQYCRSRELNWGHKQFVEAYMVFGGVPYYYKQLQSSLSLAQNIDALFFVSSASLKYEFYDMLASLSGQGYYPEILTVLATKRCGYSRQELEKDSSLPSGSTLTNKLRDLERCGFIRSFKRKTGRQNTLWYQICDSFIWFHFSAIASGKVKTWTDYMNTQSYHVWAGHAFELVCSLHIPQIKRALGISGILSDEYSPWYPPAEVEDKAQIDLVIDRKDDWVNICEMKYYDDEFEISAAYAKDLQRKAKSYAAAQRKRKVMRITLVTANGVKKNEHYYGLDAEDITMDELFI